MSTTLESDAAKLLREYEDIYGEEAFTQMAINYCRFMREHQLVQRAKRDHMMTGLCYGYLRVRSPRIVQPKKRSDKKAI